MDKTTRLNLIQNRFSALFGKSLTEMLPVSRKEIAETGKELKQSFLDSMDDSLATGDEITLRSSLALLVGEKTKETDSFLTSKERKQLQREILQWKRAKDNFRRDVEKTPLLLMA